MAIALHPKTQVAIDNYLRDPAHGLALLAPRGAGKSYLATYVASSLLRIEQDRVMQNQYVKVIAPDEKNSIRIEHAKEVVGFLRLKTTGNGTIRRVVIIEQAETMTLDAQNTLLKILEEPPADTVLIVTVSDRTAVLQTILSRLQAIVVHTPLEAELKEVFSSASPTRYEKAYRLSGGKPGLMQALIDNDTEHPMVKAIEDVKRLLALDQFSRLMEVDGIVKDKRTMMITQALSFMAESTITMVSQKSGSTSAIESWTRILKLSNEAEEQLRRNGQAKLVLANLFIHI